MEENARVGLKEEEAAQQGLKFTVNYQDTSDWYSSLRVGEHYSGSKVLMEKDSGQILSTHVLGQSADELINFFGLAIQCELAVKELKKVIFAYPTHASDLENMI